MFYWILNEKMRKYGEILRVPEEMNEIVKYMSLYDFITFDSKDDFDALNFTNYEGSEGAYIDENEFKKSYLIADLKNLNKNTINILNKVEDEEDLTKKEIKEVKQDLLQKKFTYDNFCNNSDFSKLEDYSLQIDSIAGYDDLCCTNNEENEQLENMELVGEEGNSLGGYALYKTKNGDLYFNKYSNCQGNLLYRYDIYKKVKNYKDAGVSKEEWNEMLEG
ncbi:hypothetical protein KM792_10225 [Clostridium tyrobutyricum]|uniref:hypothetical protein n=1 Tax=Clostridium tyrobutyricum TaxID=1519 RepID=UPI001C38912B|nr:hypothetical protein [Clostridium tyrobutyricum]MBV4450028.1 hypothetical protein [Clostridium tyrobutyricum]